jgi:hypothetical protein
MSAIPRPGPSPFDEEQLRTVRDFLQREFRGCRHHDSYDAARRAQIFSIEPDRGPTYVLLVPEATVQHPDFDLLFTGALADVIHEAGGVPLMLTPEGVQAA